MVVVAVAIRWHHHRPHRHREWHPEIIFDVRRDLGNRMRQRRCVEGGGDSWGVMNYRCRGRFVVRSCRHRRHRLLRCRLLRRRGCCFVLSQQRYEVRQ